MRSLLRRKSRIELKLGALVLGTALVFGVPTAHAGPLKGRLRRSTRAA